MDGTATECMANNGKCISLGGISLSHKQIPSRRQHLEEHGSTLAASRSIIPAEKPTLG